MTSPLLGSVSPDQEILDIDSTSSGDFLNSTIKEELGESRDRGWEVGSEGGAGGRDRAGGREGGGWGGR